MGGRVLPVDPSTRAADLCREVGLSDAARDLLRDDQTADEFFATLLDRKQDFDAIRVLAQAMPERLVVEWAAGCVRLVLPEGDEEQRALLAVAERWLEDPTASQRRNAARAAEAGGFDTAAAWVAAAAGWSGPAASAAAQRPPCSTATAAAGAITKAAAQDISQLTTRPRVFLERGVELAKRAGSARSQ